MTSPLRLLIQQARQKAAAEANPITIHHHKPVPAKPVPQVPQVPQNPIHIGIDRYGKQIEWNTEQWDFITTASTGKSSILIGAAGTGKTTTMRGTIEEILRNRHIPTIAASHKHLPSNTPGIIAVSYTRRAVQNLRKAMPTELQGNCITIHKALEYQPNFYEIEDPVTGERKKTMRFEPSRNRYYPLPDTIKVVIIDESSMVSVDLFAQLKAALPHNPQYIFLGDIQQLPPIFGSAILGFKSLQYPTTELVQVYRQALESPIIRLAHRILSGKGIPISEFDQWNFPNQLKLHPWKKKISADSALLTVAAFFKQAYDTNNYDPAEDQILIPFNKACGTDELNKHIANHIARKHNRMTHEVIAGYNKYYFSEGDLVLYEKEDAEIVEIKRNPTYMGKWPQAASTNLDYWGCLQESVHHISSSEDGPTTEDVDKMLDSIEVSEVEDRVKEASHVLTVKLLDSEQLVEVKSAAGINALLLSYALTIHKSQGSEWRNVYLILHNSHNTMIQRELLYTACTRAKESLYVICEPDSFEKGISGQRIKGNSLKEKMEFFKGKLESDEESLLPFVMDDLA